MRRGRSDLPMEGDPEAFAALEVLALEISAATSTGEVVDALLRLVVALGGRPVPAREVDAHILPLDLTLGSAEPVVAEAEAHSVARLHLEQALPVAVEMAQTAVHRLLLLERGDPPPPSDHRG